MKYDNDWVLANFFINGKKIFGHKDCFTEVGGQGVAIGKLLSKTTGNFKQGKMNGICEEWRLGDKEGTVIKGTFKDGYMHGKGVITIVSKKT